MRLVDADALKHKIDQEEGRRIEPGWYDGIDTCREIIENAPTIDAIPVEWLKNRREGMIFAAMTNSQVYGNNTIELCHAVNVVLDMWREEQEART